MKRFAMLGPLVAAVAIAGCGGSTKTVTQPAKAKTTVKVAQVKPKEPAGCVALVRDWNQATKLHALTINAVLAPAAYSTIGDDLGKLGQRSAANASNAIANELDDIGGPGGVTLTRSEASLLRKAMGLVYFDAVATCGAL